MVTLLSWVKNPGMEPVGMILPLTDLLFFISGAPVSSHGLGAWGCLAASPCQRFLVNCPPKDNMVSVIGGRILNMDPGPKKVQSGSSLKSRMQI